MRRLIARIKGRNGAMHHGDVLERSEWKMVTHPCYTKWGVKIKLRKWKKLNYRQLLISKREVYYD